MENLFYKKYLHSALCLDNILSFSVKNLQTTKYMYTKQNKFNLADFWKKSIKISSNTYLHS